MNQFLDMCIVELKKGTVFRATQGGIYYMDGYYWMKGARGKYTEVDEEEVRRELYMYYRANVDEYIEDKAYLEKRVI